jgi:uncharacterized membrane protein YhaH (DUF805 family)
LIDLRRHWRFVVFSVVAIGIILGSLDSYRHSLSYLNPPAVYWKDCIQPYLMGKALEAGVNPYTPLPELTARWIPSSHPAGHPTPYPPFVALLGWPLSWLSYEDSALVWFLGEIVCLELVLALMFRFWGGRWNPLKDALALGLILLAGPVAEELQQGQFTSGLLLLLTASWLALREKRDLAGGVLLGLSIAIKLTGWPILIFLMMRRRWKGARAAFLTIAAAHLAAAVAIGPGVVLDYYFRVSRINAEMWRGAEGNYSAWAWGIRLFGGAGFGVELLPAVYVPALATIATYAFPVFVLVLGLVLAEWAPTFDTSVGILLAVSLFVSPVFWYFYLLIAAIPAIVLVRRLCDRGFPREASVLAILAFVLMNFRPGFYERLARAFASSHTTDRVTIPFAPGLLLFLPVVGFLLILWLLWRFDEPAQTPDAASPDSH